MTMLRYICPTNAPDPSNLNCFTGLGEAVPFVRFIPPEGMLLY